tara:strand:- start:2246 stop:2563 length:318 start_codon:yes stop_codon:yes gene_type:complete
LEEEVETAHHQVDHTKQQRDPHLDKQYDEQIESQPEEVFEQARPHQHNHDLGQCLEQQPDSVHDRWQCFFEDDVDGVQHDVSNRGEQRNEGRHELRDGGRKLVER